MARAVASFHFRSCEFISLVAPESALGLVEQLILLTGLGTAHLSVTGRLQRLTDLFYFCKKKQKSKSTLSGNPTILITPTTIPMHVLLSLASLNPPGQTQRKLPAMLMHLDCAEQPPLYVAHSLMSMQMPWSFISYPEWQSHLKEPIVLTHLCGQP